MFIFSVKSNSISNLKIIEDDFIELTTLVFKVPFIISSLESFVMLLPFSFHLLSFLTFS